MPSATAKSVKLVLTKGSRTGYGQSPQPWQQEAIVAAATQWDEKEVRLFDHPRGSGKTREIVLMTHVALRCLGVRLALLITDRRDLDQQLHAEATRFFEKNNCGDDVLNCTSGQELDKIIVRLAEDPKARAIITITLQSFPFVTKKLPPALRAATLALADEAHRSHADKSLSEELARVFGGPVHFFLYTGTASNRCLRLFGERAPEQIGRASTRTTAAGGDERRSVICKPFHSVSEEVVSQAGMIFKLGELRRTCVELQANLRDVEMLAKELKIGTNIIPALERRVRTSRVEKIVMAKAVFFMDRFMQVKQDTPAFRPQMMVVTSSRRSVLDYVEACRAYAAEDGEEALTVYGAFSNRLKTDGREAEVDEVEFNRDLVDASEEGQAHRMADVLVVCDRFETGYENDRICVVAVDKRITSEEKLVQVYSRGNRCRQGKAPPLVLDVQNPRKDIEKAIVAYTMPRVCPADDKAFAGARSAELRLALGDLAEAAKEQLESGLAAWGTDARRSLADLLKPYLRCRKEGVNHSSGKDLFSLKQAELVWCVLSENHRSDTRNAEEAGLRALADRAAGKGVALSVISVLDSAPAAFGGSAASWVTPQKRPHQAAALAALPTPGAAGGDAETPDILGGSGRRLSLIERLQASLPDGADSDGEMPIRPAVAIEEEVRRLMRAKGHGKRRVFQSLQRVAEAAADRATAKTLFEAGVVPALVGRLVEGEQVEQRWALQALRHLAEVCPRARRLCQAAAHIEAIQAATNLRERELAALKDLASLLTDGAAVASQARDAEARIGGARDRLASSRREHARLQKQKVPTIAELLQGDLARSLFPWRDGRTMKERKEEARAKHYDARAKLLAQQETKESEVEAAQEEVIRLEAALAKVNDAPTLLVLGVSAALRGTPALCKGRFKIQGKRQVLKSWEALGAFDPDWKGCAVLAQCISKVEAARRARNRSTAEDAVREARAQFRGLHPKDMELATDLRLVEDLLAISVNPRQVNQTAIDWLSDFAEQHKGAAQLVEKYDAAVLRNASGLSDEELADARAAALDELPRQRAAKRSRPSAAEESAAVGVAA